MNMHFFCIELFNSDLYQAAFVSFCHMEVFNYMGSLQKKLRNNDKPQKGKWVNIIHKPPHSSSCSHGCRHSSIYIKY